MKPGFVSPLIRPCILGLAGILLFGSGTPTMASDGRPEAAATKDSPDAETTIRFQCPAGLGLVATFLPGDTPSVRLELGGDIWILRRVPSANGTKYSDGTVTFWTKGDSARFESPDLSMTCTTAGTSPDGVKALNSSTWKLLSITQNGTEKGVPENVNVDATFEDGRVSGKGVCNRYFATYKVSKDQTISIGDIGATLMMCPEHADFERLYFQMLKASTRFEAHGGILVLTGPTGSLRFVEDR